MDVDATAPPLSNPARALALVTRLARALYVLIAAVYVGGIVTQVFAAGLAVLVDPAYWSLHRGVGPLLAPIALAMLVVGLAARLPWRLLWLTAALFPLFVLQYVFLYAPLRFGVLELRALHAVNALVLFSLGLYLVRRAIGLLRRGAPERVAV